MIGQKLGGRYEILQEVGSGGMALVYKSHDLLLHRFVAVKVLRQQYVNDEEFIRRFRREAQSAASLSHANIVSIYDVGKEEDIHYIVMEYVEGKTLNDLIKEKAPLQVEEAVHIASQICDALEHAHANHIIHRDIKPHNILIGRNGRVKVTDFGIARATASTSITQTGSVLGSVHYFSPEHAKGTLTGAKSDLYSLGIVLYQMLTARLPFIGESPISVALKHLREEMEAPRKVNPLIPQSLENIIVKSTRKNQDERYQSATTMMQDLETCLQPLRRNESKLIFRDENVLDGEQTRVIPAIRPDQYAKSIEREKESSSKKVWLAPLIWGILLLFTIILLWFVGLPFIKTLGPMKDVEIPNVENQTIVYARNALKNAGLNYDEAPQSSDKIAKDIVISQNPKGMKTKVGNTIRLLVSTGMQMQNMVNYEGRKFIDVQQELLAAGVKNERIIVTEKFMVDEIGTIVQQQPKPNQSYDPSLVEYKFTVSKGQQKFSMPDLTGLTKEQARKLLIENNLALAAGDAGIVEKPSFDQPKGKVFDQFPFKKGDEVEVGQNNIVIYISTGKPEDTYEMTVTPVLKPAKEGKESVFKVILTDAQYENFDYITKQVSKDEILTMQVTVKKDKNAVVKILRDNVLYDTQTFTYNNYLDQQQKPKATDTAKPIGTSSGSPTPSGSGTPVTTKSPTPTPKAATPTTSPGGN